MKRKVLLLAQCLMLSCASILSAQVVPKAGPAKPGSTISRTTALARAPAVLTELPNLRVKDMKNLAFDPSKKVWRLEAEVANTGKADSPPCNLGVEINFVGGTSRAIRKLPTVPRGASIWLEINLELGQFTNSNFVFPPSATLVTVIADVRFKYQKVIAGGDLTQIVFLKPDDPGIKDLNRHDPTVFESNETDNELALRPEQINKLKH